MTKVKICGLRDLDTVRRTDAAGADWIGFNFVEASPRFVTPAAAASLLLPLRTAQPVALVADADDAWIDQVAATGISILQLHGSESPQRVAEIKARTGLEIWKACGIGSLADMAAARAFEAADCLLLDAKPPKDAAYAGGHGVAFDWSILTDAPLETPWILAGGLTPDNVAGAISATGAPAVDVSSGVEHARGLKDRKLIEAFIRAAKEA